MALTNFTLPFGSLTQTAAAGPWSPTVSPLHPIHHQLATNTNNLLYSPVDHQQQPGDGAAPPPGSDFYKNNPYAPPQQTSYQHYNGNNNGRRKNTYLPPVPAPPGTRNTQYHVQQPSVAQQLPQQYHHQQQHQQQFSHINNQQQQQNNNNGVYKTASSSSSATITSSLTASTASATSSNVGPSSNTRTYGEGSTAGAINFGIGTTTTNVEQPPPATQYGGPSPPATANKAETLGNPISNDAASTNDAYPDRPPGFTRVQAGQGSRTGVHAVLDYDLEEGEEEEYYDAEDQGEPVNKDGSHKSPMPTVTPIQGPIYLKNGTVPVVPLFHYPTFNNGSFVQIPIWWTALSVALGLDVRGDLIKGVPCIKRYHQLFCPTAGNSYPIDKIERFIDDNKALMRRMYGDFEMNMDNGGPNQQTKKRRRRFIDEPDIFLPPGAFPSFVADDDVEPHDEEHGESYFGKLRNKRQANQGNRDGKQGNRNAKQTGPRSGQQASPTGRLDACESKVEIVTPYWASNSAGKIRAIVNTQHFEQAIHQEICSKAQTPRCSGECGCEQKYKWHRLLAYDPDNDCKGIFMDWFLFPSCCVCRCNP
ncbi:spaetzle domain-containing protein 3 isoform X2 [Musca autumnalis]|uniref:spaetzle domain-containing protein 3 isoform X2 n=1 Tax=Musca autumnalis TaxID=221902 RepID=UPI003CF48B61